MSCCGINRTHVIPAHFHYHEPFYRICPSLSFFSQLNNFSVFSLVSIYQWLNSPIPLVWISVCGALKHASGAERYKADSFQVMSEDCIQTVWQSTLISPCWAAWSYWARPCTSVSLQCTQWGKPTELMGNGRERGERKGVWMICCSC